MENDFNLGLAIFTPFKGFPPNPIDPIQEVTAQQDLVRGNMVNMVHARAQALIATANTEIAALPAPSEEETRSVAEARRRDLDEMMRCVRAPAKADVDPQEYVLKPGVKMYKASEGNRKDADGDVDMDGAVRERAAKETIRERLVGELEALVEFGTNEMEGYNKHCVEKVLPSLRRRGSVQQGDAVTGAPPGILKNSNGANPVPWMVRTF